MVRDNRTRQSHVNAHGQVRFPGEPFQVGHADLMEPRDPDGPPGETFNCRCLKEVVPISQLPPDLLSQIEGRLSDEQRRFLNPGLVGIRVADASGGLLLPPTNPGVEISKKLLQKIAKIEAKLNAGGVLQSLTVTEASVHYLMGTGKTITVTIDDPARNLKISDHKDVIKVINTFNGKVGTFSILVDNFAMTTKSSAHGDVTFKFQGKIQVDKTGWQIKGDLKAYNDRFDFNPRDIGERNLFVEMAIRAIDATQGTIGQEFEVSFDGAKNIQERGRWKSTVK